MRPATAIRSTLLLTAFALTAQPAAAGEREWLKSLDEALTKAQAENRDILVDLYADWCGWCKKLEQEVFSDPEFLRFAEPFVLLQVDVMDGGEGEALQARYGAFSLPTTLVLSPKMVKIGEVRGYSNARAYTAYLRMRMTRYQADVARWDEILKSDDPKMLLPLAREVHGRGDGARAAEAYRRLLASSEPVIERPQLLYALADALRLDEDLEGAETHLAESRRLAAAERDHQLVEALDLLRVEIVRHRGDCRETVAMLESFLREHPTSSHKGEARENLRLLRRTEECS